MAKYVHSNFTVDSSTSFLNKVIFKDLITFDSSIKFNDNTYSSFGTMSIESSSNYYTNNEVDVLLNDITSGHVIKENGVSSPIRTNLNFVSANNEDIIKDDSANDETDIELTLKSLNDFDATGLIAGSFIIRNLSNTGFISIQGVPFDLIKNSTESNISSDRMLLTYIPAGYAIEEIIIVNETANAAGNISIGSTESGTNIINALTVGANADIRTTIVTNYFSSVNDTYMYISSSDWGTESAFISIYFTLKKVI